MRYAVLIENDECSFCATSPDVPGIFSFGETAEVALEGFREALPHHLRALMACGGHLPRPTTIAEMIEVEDVA